MEHRTIQVLNTYAERTDIRTDIVDIFAVDFGLKRGAIIHERGVDGFKDVFVEDFGFSYEYDEEHGFWYICDHPSLLQLVRDGYLTEERHQVALGLFCSYDYDSILAWVRDESLDSQQAAELAENEFQEFLASHHCYYPYSPAPTSLCDFFDRAERRYTVAKTVEPLFGFDFPSPDEEVEKQEVEA
jgi:hypothetical protein